MLVTRDTFEQMLSSLWHHPYLVVDTETTGLRPYHGDRICGIAVSSPMGQRYYLPFRHKDDPDNLPIECMQPLLRILEQAPLLIGHNISFDLHMLRQDGCGWPQRIADTLLRAHLVNENEASYKLENLALKYFGTGADVAEQELLHLLADIGYTNKDAKGHLWELPARKVEPYACEDIDLTERLYHHQMQGIEGWRLQGVVDGVMEYRLALTKMEAYGILIDAERYLTNMKQEEDNTTQFLQICRELSKNLDFNPNSPKQVCELLHIPSSRAKVLEYMESPLAQAILQYRDHAKCNGTFYHAYIPLIDEDGLIHTHYRPEGTVTGRLSSAEPNLQQVPPRVRTVFIPRPGYEFLAIDYDQAELRLAVHYSQDKRMYELITGGHDVHQETATSVGVTRKQGKIVNFASIYQAGPKALAPQMGVSIEDAIRAWQLFHKTYPGFGALSRKMQQMAERHRYIKYPLTGRIRRYPAFIGDPHKAMPNLIQGTLAEIVRLVLTRIDKEVDPLDARMILQVHDEILFEVPKGQSARIYPQLEDIMMRTAIFDPPLTVSPKIGPAWGFLKEARFEQSPAFI